MAGSGLRCSAPDARNRGFVTTQTLAAIGLSMVVFTLLANLIVVQFAQGALRAAADSGARAGSIQGDAGACMQKAADSLTALVPGPIRNPIVVDCEPAVGVMRATVKLRMQAWVPGVPDFELSATSVATLEQ